MFIEQISTQRNFSPVAPVKSATGLKHVGTDFAQISINAPVKSATGRKLILSALLLDFNQRTREECDISTDRDDSVFVNFNQRTREECDRRDLLKIFIHVISINAPVKTATLSLFQ